MYILVGTSVLFFVIIFAVILLFNANGSSDSNKNYVIVGTTPEEKKVASKQPISIDAEKQSNKNFGSVLELVDYLIKTFPVIIIICLFLPLIKLIFGKVR
jgi:hypothetical protein